MNTWNQLPLLKILLPFIAGIIAALTITIDMHIPYGFIISFVVAICLFILLYKRIIRKYNYRWVLGMLLNIVFFISGYELADRSSAKNQATYFCHFRSATDKVIATVIEPVNERENTCRVLLRMEKLLRNDSLITVSGLSLVYIEKDSLAKNIKYGDQLILSAKFSDVNPPQNPGEFDYKSYLAMRRIYSQGFVKAGAWQLLQQNNGNIIKSLALQVRESFLKIFESNNITGDEYAVAGALILGYTDKIDADLISIYQGTGALHILSVSGMHVGVVFIVLNFLLSFLDKFKRGKYFKPIILLLLIWFYAAITGLSPAVNRAAAMITFVIAGKLFGRNTNIYNTLSASMLLLLLIDPLLIKDIGFQLSYIAVAGIVMFQKRIYKIWVPDNWLLNQLWLIVTVSVAAQLSTFPLSVLYFHQFPNYFLITNIIVVPLSNFIIYCGMLVLFVSPVGALATVFAKILVYLVYALNESIRFIEALPYSVTKGIHISSTETIILYAGIISISIFLLSRKSIYLKYALALAILFSSLVTIKSFFTEKQKKFIVYSLKRSSAIDFISGSDHIVISDSALQYDAKTIAMHLQNNWLNLNLKYPEFISQGKLKVKNYRYENHSVIIMRNFIQFYNKRIAIVNASNYLNVSEYSIPVDYLIISGNINVEIGELLDSYKPKMIIFDSSNSIYKSEKWITECAIYNIPCYSVLKSGAFEVSIFS